MATISAAEEARPLVAHQLAAAVGKDWRPIDQARSILLDVPRGESSDAAAVWGYGAADRSDTAACGAGALEANKSVIVCPTVIPDRSFRVKLSDAWDRNKMTKQRKLTIWPVSGG